MTDSTLVFIIVFLSVFLQTSVGFGVALISMPVLVESVGYAIAAPLIALAAMTCRIFMLLRYRDHFSLRDVWRLIVVSMLFIPVGFLIANRINERVVEIGLGLIVTGYGFFLFLTPQLPSFERNRWAYSMGAISGVLAGAYNFGGTPAVVYATGREWPPRAFKSNLQAFAIISNTMVLLTRGLHGEFTGTVMEYYWLTLPAVALGLLAGFALDRYLKPLIFRRAVQMLLILVGLQLVF